MSSRQPQSVDATFYAVIAPTWSRWGKDAEGRPLLEGAKVDRITQTRPQTVSKGGVVTRLTLRVDAAALLPLQPEAIIHVHAGQTEVIEVQAADPRDPDAPLGDG